MEKIRSFIAIELPGELKQALSQLQQTLKSSGASPIKWVDSGNIHLTLKFLGDVNVDITGRITSAIEAAVKDTPPFFIEASGLGVFPNMNRVQIVWVGLHGDMEKLGRIQKSIESFLKPLGFPAENRPFTPHLTLARVRDFVRPAERDNLGKIISVTNFTEKYKIHVNAVQLMKSQLTREGPIYSKISTTALK